MKLEPFIRLFYPRPTKDQRPVVFIVALKSDEYPEMPMFAKHAALCAQRHSGCRVVLLSDHKETGWTNAEPYMESCHRNLQKIKLHTNGAVPRETWMLFRWFVMEEFIFSHNITAPVIAIDWDCLVFDELWPYFRSCGIENVDYGACFDWERIRNYMQACVVRTLPAIRMFTGLVSAALDSWPPALINERGGFAGGADMLWWNNTRVVGGYKAAPINVWCDGRLFDSNIILDGDSYEHDRCFGKKVTMKDGKPHFIRKDGQLVKAVAVHCFMEWKKRTAELLC